MRRCERLPLEQYGVPPLYCAASLGDFNPATCALVGTPDAHHAGYTLIGKQGTGKTHLAVAIMEHMIEHRHTDKLLYQYFPRQSAPSARFVVVPELIMDMKGSFGSKKSSIAIMRQVGPHVKCVVLDDVFATNNSEWDNGFLYRVLAERINHQTFTIVTSNLTLREIHGIDPRMASRLAGLTVITMDGKDRRIQQTESEG